MPRVCLRNPPIPPIRWRRQMISSSNPERFDPSQTTWKKSIRVVIPRMASLQHYTVCLQAASAKRTIGEAHGKYQQSTFCWGGRCRIFHRFFENPHKNEQFLRFLLHFWKEPLTRPQDQDSFPNLFRFRAPTTPHHWGTTLDTRTRTQVPQGRGCLDVIRMTSRHPWMTSRHPWPKKSPRVGFKGYHDFSGCFHIPLT